MRLADLAGVTLRTARRWKQAGKVSGGSAFNPLFRADCETKLPGRNLLPQNSLKAPTMDIPALLGSVKAATEIAKLIHDSGTTLEKAETKLKLADLISALADVKMEVAEVQQALLEKDEALRNLRSQLDTQKSIVFERPYYWTNADGKKDGPFCQPCFDNNQKLIRLQSVDGGHWHCLICDKHVVTAEAKAADDAAMTDFYNRQIDRY